MGGAAYRETGGLLLSTARQRVCGEWSTRYGVGRAEEKVEEKVEGGGKRR